MDAGDLGKVRSPFDILVGTEVLSDDPDDTRLRVPIRDELRQPVGLVHGGVLSTLIESACSRGTAMTVFDAGMVAMGQSISVNFVRPVLDGYAEVRARAAHRGRTTWVWEAEVFDAEERLCATAMMTVAVRPAPKRFSDGS